MTIKVANMSCNHCVQKIQKALVINGIMAHIDLDKKEITLKKESDLKKAIEVISEAGYKVIDA